MTSRLQLNLPPSRRSGAELATQPLQAPGTGTATQPSQAPGAGPEVLTTGMESTQLNKPLPSRCTT